MFASLLMVAGLASSNLQDQITIVATTDVHGRAMHWDYVHDREAPWGLTRAASVVDSIRRATDDAVVLVDAGDLFQGNLFARYYATEGSIPRHPIVDAFNAMRYDAFTPGNHDFDYGVDFLESALAHAQFNVVSANIYGTERHTFREYVVVRRSGVRVGITGATTPGAALWNADRIGGRRSIRPIVPEIRRALERMEAEGVDVKVVVLHSGLGGRSSYDARAIGEENVAAQVAFLPVKPDIVVVGHTHRAIRDSVINGVHFIQAEPWARGLAVADVRLVLNAERRLVLAGLRGTNISLAGVAPDEELMERIEHRHERARSWGNQPLATAPVAWNAQFSRAEDTPIIDFVNHVQMQNTGAQLSATAAFNLEARFPEGPVRIRHVAALYPFENTLRVVAIDGRTLKQYLERAAEFYQTYVPGGASINPAIPGYNYDMVSGLEYVIDVTRPPGSRVRQMVFDGRIVQPTDQFSLAVNNHRLVAGGYDMLSDLPIIQTGSRRIFDMLVEELRNAETVVSDSYYQPSWSLIPADAQTAARVAFGAPDPLTTERHAVRILATTDLGGVVRPRRTAWSEGREVGGLAALGGWFDSLASACACPTIVLDGGGALGGSLIADRTFGRLMVDAMNAMQYDAAAIGERELAWGVDTLESRASHARFPWLAANARLASGNARPEWTRDWVMIEREGVRVAVVGLTAGTTGVVSLSAADRFVLDDMASSLRRAASQARAAGADFVVLLAHVDAYCEPSGCRGGLIDLVNQLEPGAVDLVIGGHSGSEATATINDIPILLPGAQTVSLGVADVFTTGAGARRIESRTHTVWVDSVSADEGVELLVQAASFDADAVITRMQYPATASVGEESALGRLVADAYRNAARAHVAVVRNAAIAGSLSEGEVTYGDVYEVQPVQHVIRRLRVRGEVIEEVLEHVVRGSTPIAHISGLEIEYDANGRPGDRIRRIRRDGDRSFRRGDMYWLAVSDFVANGGGGYAMLRGLESESVGVSDFQALAHYLSRLRRPVDPPRDVRIRARR